MSAYKGDVMQESCAKVIRRLLHFDCNFCVRYKFCSKITDAAPCKKKCNYLTASIICTQK